MQVLSEAKGLASNSFRVRSKSFRHPKGLACKSFQMRADLPPSRLGSEKDLLASPLGREANPLGCQKDLHASPIGSERTFQQVF